MMKRRDGQNEVKKKEKAGREGRKKNMQSLKL